MSTWVVMVRSKLVSFGRRVTTRRAMVRIVVAIEAVSGSWC